MSDIRVLIVDDSPTVQRVFKKGLSRAKGITVVGVAPDPFVARDMIVKDPPDVLCLDIEMPRMDGLTFLRKLMKHFPMPVVVVSTLTKEGGAKAMEALECGAVEVVEKNMGEDRINDLMLEVVSKVRSAASATVVRKAIGAHKAATRATGSKVIKTANASSEDRVVAIGASTGGTEALSTIFERLPADTPGTLVVQHMPPGFTAQMAERLNSKSAMTVKEAQGGELLVPGLALIAPGDHHIILKKSGSQYLVELRSGPRVSRHKPSVDVLFSTVAEAAGDKAVGVILTGMGRDGSLGMKKMHDKGAFTIGQNEESCVVYGMPREAFEIGAVDQVTPLNLVPEKICKAVSTVKV
ncbi:MAG: chemotaxis response regulator protein-glutamate methylesterase [bacterium]|nr:chemotaxis response regulator protein-glutamate methylesterase [bacterium]